MTKKEKLAIVKKAKQYYIKRKSDFMCNCICDAIEDICGLDIENVFEYIPELKKYKPKYFDNNRGNVVQKLMEAWFHSENRKPRMEIFNALIKELK